MLRFVCFFVVCCMLMFYIFVYCCLLVLFVYYLFVCLFVYGLFFLFSSKDSLICIIPQTNNTYHGLCYTSLGAVARTRKNNGSIMKDWSDDHCTMSYLCWIEIRNGTRQWNEWTQFINTSSFCLGLIMLILQRFLFLTLSANPDFIAYVYWTFYVHF